MNVYDFDKTIYVRDSTVDFYRFCLGRYPGILRFAPGQLSAGIRYGLGRIEKTAFKQAFFAYFRSISDLERLASAFWDGHAQDIQAWYMARQQPDDLVISASPEFLLRPICTRLGIRHLLASRVNPATGAYTGANCDGQEKVRRFREAYPRGEIDRFYSDSLSDTPLARLARESYIVRGDRLIPWDQYEAAGHRR